MVLGSLDYLRIALREEKLNKHLKNDLYAAVASNLSDVDKIYSKCSKDSNVFEHMNLDNIIKHFDRMQNFIAYDLEVPPILDNDSFDDSLFV